MKSRRVTVLLAGLAFGAVTFCAPLVVQRIHETYLVQRLIAARDGEWEKVADRLLRQGNARSACHVVKAVLDRSPNEILDWQVKLFSSVTDRVIEVLPAYETTLSELNPSARRAAIRALGTPGWRRSEVVRVLARALRNPDEIVRWQAAYVLADFGAGARESVPELTVALSDASPNVRWAVLKAIGSVSDATTDPIPAVLNALNDPCAAVAHEAMTVLKLYGPRARTQFAAALGALVEAPQTDGSTVSFQIDSESSTFPDARPSPSAMGYLPAECRSPSGCIVHARYGSLNWVWGVRGLSALANLPDDPGIGTCPNAMRGIAAMVDLVPVVYPAVDQCAEVLGHLATSARADPTSAVTARLSRLQMAWGWECDGRSDSLVELPITHLLQLLRTGSPFASDELGGRRIASDATVATVPARALSAVGERAISALVTAAADSDPSVQTAAMYALAIMRPLRPEVSSVFREFRAVDSPEVRALAAFGTLRQYRDAAEFERIAEDLVAGGPLVLRLLLDSGESFTAFQQHTASLRYLANILLRRAVEPDSGAIVTTAVGISSATTIVRGPAPEVEAVELILGDVGDWDSEIDRILLMTLGFRGTSPAKLSAGRLLRNRVNTSKEVRVQLLSAVLTGEDPNSLESLFSLLSGVEDVPNDYLKSAIARTGSAGASDDRGGKTPNGIVCAVSIERAFRDALPSLGDYARDTEAGLGGLYKTFEPLLKRSRLGQSLVPLMEESLDNPSEYVRVLSATLLWRSNGSERRYESILRSALKSTDWFPSSRCSVIRRLAVRCLAAIGDHGKGFASLIIGATDYHDPVLWLLAVEAIWRVSGGIDFALLERSLEIESYYPEDVSINSYIIRSARSQAIRIMTVFRDVHPGLRPRMELLRARASELILLEADWERIGFQ